MAVTQTSQITIKVQGTLTNATLGTARDEIALDYTTNLGPGAGAGQANEIYRATRTLTASATEDLDLSGVLSDALGVSVALTKVKAIVVHAASGNTNNVKVGGGNTTFSLFVDPTDSMSIKPNGTFVLTDPSAAGIAVTNASTDLLTVTNSAGSTSVSYDIVVFGS